MYSAFSVEALLVSSICCIAFDALSHVRHRSRHNPNCVASRLRSPAPSPRPKPASLFINVGSPPETSNRSAGAMPTSPNKFCASSSSAVLE